MYNFNALSPKVELGLARVLEEQLHGLLELERVKSKLYTFSNYNLEYLFDFLDRDRKGYLTIDDLDSFLEEFAPNRLRLGERRIGLTTSKPERILKRMDRDRNETISFNEFCKGIRP